MDNDPNFLKCQSGHFVTLTNGQRGQLINLVNRVAETREARLWIISRLLGREITTANDVMPFEWSVIRVAAYDGKDIRYEFKRELTTLNRSYKMRLRIADSIVSMGENQTEMIILLRLLDSIEREVGEPYKCLTIMQPPM